MDRIIALTFTAPNGSSTRHETTIEKSAEAPAQELLEHKHKHTVSKEFYSDAEARRHLCAVTLPGGSTGHAWLFWRKRIMDLVLATLAIVCLLPVLLLIAALIRLDSPGPIIYRQERVGARRRKIGGKTVWEIRTFSFFKFRSMYSNASSSAHQEFIAQFCRGKLSANNGDKASFKLCDDPRISRLGRILRKTSLDELPQLVNVMLGDMSLVGPRPLPLYEVAQHPAVYYERHACLGGITGQWQIDGRGRVPFESMMRMDIDYVRYPSLLRDLSIMLRTIPAVLSARGAR